MRLFRILAITWVALLMGLSSKAQDSNLNYFQAEATTNSDTMEVVMTNSGTESLCMTYLFVQGSFVAADGIIIQDDVMFLNSGQLDLQPGESKVMKFPIHNAIQPEVTFTVFENCNPDESRKVFSFE